MFTEPCVICQKPQDDGGVTISRCCCDSDWVCSDCVRDKSLAEYIRKAVALADVG